jgi:hypothetical protein
MSQHDDLFQELGRTLEVSPSRGFADGVHARIARRRLMVRATMSGLAVAASLLIAVMVRGPEPAIVGEPSRMAAAASPVPTAPVPTPNRVTPAVREPRAAASRPATVARAVAADDRLLVVTNQMAILQAAWAPHQVAAAETEAPPVEVVTPPDPSPVVVEPVRVLPVVIADQRAPINGLPIIRRAVAALESK